VEHNLPNAGLSQPLAIQVPLILTAFNLASINMVFLIYIVDAIAALSVILAPGSKSFFISSLLAAFNMTHRIVLKHGT
jgi:hypothetical protein